MCLTDARLYVYIHTPAFPHNMNDVSYDVGGGCVNVKTDWCMSLEIVNRALDFSKSSALFSISSDMHQSVFTVCMMGRGCDKHLL